jgi:hypothetical protein
MFFGAVIWYRSQWFAGGFADVVSFVYYFGEKPTCSSCRQWRICRCPMKQRPRNSTDRLSRQGDNRRWRCRSSAKSSDRRDDSSEPKLLPRRCVCPPLRNKRASDRRREPCPQQTRHSELDLLSDGQPYFVMEYVAGVPGLEFARLVATKGQVAYLVFFFLFLLRSSNRYLRDAHS